MAVTYRTIDKEGKEVFKISGNCYRLIYNYLLDYNSVTVYYTFNHEQTDTAYAWTNNLTEEQIVKYIELLNEIGFNIVYNPVDNYPDYGECRSFFIDLSKNSIISAKILLNAIRYIFENNYYIIVETFLRYMEEDIDNELSMLNKLILAQAITRKAPGGHSFVPSSIVAKFVKENEFSSKILEDNSLAKDVSNITSTSQWLSTIQINKLNNLINSPFKEAFEYYKTLNGWQN